MKVGVVGLRGVPNIMGGIETHCQQLYPRMLKNNPGLDITIVGRSPYLHKDQYHYEGVNVESVWTLRNKYLETILHTFISIFFVKFKLQADCIHIHAIGPGLLSPLARLLGLKVVMTHHGSDYDRDKWNWFAKSLLRFGEWLSVKFANEVLVVGKSLTERLRQQYPRKADSISFIPNGIKVDTYIDEEFNQKKLLNSLGVEPKKYILFVGRLVPEKGVQDLINAYKQLKNTDYKLLVVGSSDHKDEFYKMIMDFKSENIIFAGFQKGNALKSLYENAAVFVLPSYHEGLPIVVLEALGYGLPILVSDIQPNLDIELPSNCYFETASTSELSEKLSQNEYDAFRLNYEEFFSYFSWDRISDMVLDKYCKL